jgi:large subunit ribosomal protein L4
MGSKRSPLLPGGGVTFGPRPRDWSIKMNKKERRLAMATALQSAAGDIVVVESAAMAEPKTKALVQALAGVGADPMARNVLLVVSEVGDGLQRAARNVERLSVNKVAALNASDVLRADKIVVEKGALAAIQEFYGPNTRE